MFEIVRHVGSLDNNLVCKLVLWGGIEPPSYSYWENVIKAQLSFTNENGERLHASIDAI